MSRYIDAKYNLHDLPCYFDFSDEELDAISTVLKLMPTADVVEVVRCKDCKHYSADGWGYGNCYRGSVEYLRMADNGFCSYGERREDVNAI